MGPIWAHMRPARAHEVRETLLEINTNLENCSVVESMEIISQSSNDRIKQWISHRMSAIVFHINMFSPMEFLTWSKS